MRRRSPGGRALCVALLAAWAVGCDRSERTSPAPEAPAHIADRVRVLNADVLVIDGQHVRLAGYYAPQGVPDARCWAEALAAKQATEAVRRMVVTGRTIHFEPAGGKDDYGRQYARVLLNGLDLGQTLHDEGLAAKVSGSFGWCGPISQQEPGAPPLKAVMDIGG